MRRVQRNLGPDLFRTAADASELFLTMSAGQSKTDRIRTRTVRKRVFDLSQQTGELGIAQQQDVGGPDLDATNDLSGFVREQADGMRRAAFDAKEMHT